MISVKLNHRKIIEKVTNDTFGYYVSHEWKRLINPYTPRDTGAMQDTAIEEPFRIRYIQPYSERIYHGSDYNFQKNNPYSTAYWDIAAVQAGQKAKLYRTLNNYLRSK